MKPVLTVMQKPSGTYCFVLAKTGYEIDGTPSELAELLKKLPTPEVIEGQVLPF